MSTAIDYTPYEGGLDQTSSALAVKPGRLAQCLNFEQVFGVQGYRTIEGNERYDGRAQPHLAAYWVQGFKTGTAAIVAGDIVTGTGVTGEVVAVVLTSGSWLAGDAAGLLVVTSLSGAWADGGNIQVSASTKALADGVTEPGSIGQASNDDWLRLARSAARAKIQQVPGEGPVLGVAVYRYEVYAVRNAAGNASATLWKSSPAGWQAVRTGLYPGGRWRFQVANFSGASTTIALFGVDGRNRPFKWDGTTYTPIAPIFGSQGTSSSSLTVGAGSKAFTIVESTRSWQVGDTLVAWDRANAGNSMTGTVASYTGGVLTLTVTAATGSGTISAWEIGRADFLDKPYDLAAHKDHMFLAYPLGQLQTSNLGDPLLYTTSAALFGMGGEITGITTLRGAQLGIFTANKIWLLSGTSVTDWQLDLHSDGAGAMLGTVQDNVGNAVFLDTLGLMSLQATQAIGGFEPAVFSSAVGKMLEGLRGTLVATRLTRKKYQYRMYFSGGQVLTFALMTGDPVIRPKDVAVTAAVYPAIPTCCAQGPLGGGVTEALFFGTADGYVMREDVGTSFDGEAIDYVLKVPFHHFKSPANKKRFRKLVLELDCPDRLDIFFRQIFDYDDGTYRASDTQTATSIGTGGQFDVSAFDTFLWSLPQVAKAEANTSGVGTNMALLLWAQSDLVRPLTLQGLLTHYTPLGMKR